MNKILVTKTARKMMTTTWQSKSLALWFCLEKMNSLPFAKRCLLPLIGIFSREYLKASHVVCESKGPVPGLHTKGLQIGLPVIEGGLFAILLRKGSQQKQSQSHSLTCLGFSVSCST